MKPQDQFGLDALLGRWPAPDPQGSSWDERADKIVAAAVALKDKGSGEVIGALVEAPSLVPEAGEESGARGFDVVGPAQEVVSGPRETERAGAGGGAQKMSSDQAKRPSLKELAARASQAGASRPSVSSVPPPVRDGRASIPGESRTSAPPVVSATVTPIHKARSSASGVTRTSDSGREDSGVLRLADLQKPAPAAEAQEPAPAAAAPAAATSAAKPAVAKPAAAASGGGSRSGVWAGGAIAVLGIAAAIAVYQTRKPEQPKADVVADVKPVATPAQTEAPKPQPASEPSAVASNEPAQADAPKGDEAKPSPSGAAAPSTTAIASADLKGTTPAKDAPKGSKVGTLDEEMKKATGTSDLPSAPQDDGSKPAAGGGGNLPDQPSQGNAQAAIRAVMGGAKACVAGAPELTTASVTFGSSGSVQSVSVGGWAAANGKSACVKSALQGAHVAPFAKPTFTLSVNVRP